MKVRKYFVSNSSSSSFVCSVCRCAESGMDASLEDFEMHECENGHTFCDSHMSESIDELSKDDVLEVLEARAKKCEGSDKEWRQKQVKALRAEIAALRDSDDEDLLQETIENHELDSRYEICYKYCPICMFTEPSFTDICKYLEKEDKLDALVDEIKERFDNDYGKFLKYTRTA